MPRPKGSTNNMVNLIKKLESQGYIVQKSDKAILPKEAPAVDLKHTPVTFAPVTGDRETLVLKKRETKSKGDTWTCGVKICGYTSDSEFDICPKCGARNTWG
jgi:rubrerythrin